MKFSLKTMSSQQRFETTFGRQTRARLAPYLQLATAGVLGFGLLGSWPAGEPALPWAWVLGLGLLKLGVNQWGMGQARHRPDPTRVILLTAAVDYSTTLAIVILTGGLPLPFWLLFLTGAVTSALYLAPLGILTHAVTAWIALFLLLPGVPSRQSLASIGLFGFIILITGLACYHGLVYLLQEQDNHARAEKALAQSERDYRGLFENSHDAILILGPEQDTVLEMNGQAEQLFGFLRSELIGRSLRSLLVPFPAVPGPAQAGDPGWEMDYTRPDGSEIILEANLARVNYQGKAALLFVGREITRRKQAEAQVRASLHEKEVLLKEIHHRVKNNLQVISSLLNMSAAQVSDPQARQVFQDSQNRIRSMALIHEKLYRSKDLGQVDIRDYIQSLSSQLFQLYRRKGREVELDLEAEPVALNIDTAISCGLMLNELISNALAHAFPPDQSGCVTIRFSQDAQRACCLVVADNGSGLPPGLDWQRSSTLGLQLVQNLADQLNGQLELQSGAQGTRFTLTFPV